MRSVLRLMMIGLVPLGLLACATVPSTDELQRLNGEELRSVLVGNTYTFRADYGRWAEYVASSDTGYGKASGDWGSNSATGTYSISDDGEWCAIYEGEHESFTPEHEYCVYVYTDGEGNYYGEKTKDTYKPHTVGTTKKVEIRSGDAYGLSE